ncbi:hypothetical protein J4449_02680 [Candidatus Woesearchaeota archaeon]|nr:hypothetical protein [Candidatus Woesearchaeota archaeon]
MFGVSYQDIIKRINQETNISSEEIELKVKEKLSKMSDLVTKEGAAHIVAHELGVKIFQPVGKLTIDKLIAGMNSVNLLCKVVKLFGVREFKTEKRQGKVANLLVGDETGIIKLVMWDTNQIKLIEDSQIKENTILKIKNGYIKENNGFKEFHLGNRSQITINPENETLNVKEVQLQQEFFKKQIKDLGDNDVNVSVFGTITQIFEPRFYEACPECNKKVRLYDGKFICDAHGSVQEKLVPILNFIFDDGTESIRTTAFRNQAEQIIEKSSKELYELRQFPEKLEEIKNKIIGKQINILVKVNKNEMFGRKELNVQRILDSNVIEEMQIS